MNRRGFLLSAVAASASCTAGSPGRRRPFRLAICNETFQGTGLADACREARRAGYEGVEIAPFTLSEDPATLSASARSEVRRMLDGEGLEFVGLHWLLRAPRGLHVTTPDVVLRERSWEYVGRLVDLCGDFGNGGVMVFGSGKARSTTDGATREEALARFEEGLAAAAQRARDRNVTILIEPLARPYSDIVNTVDEAAGSVRRIGSPAVRTMIDCRQSAAAGTSATEAVRRHSGVLRHVHVNERDGRHPGTGSFDFEALLATLRDVGYGGWLSVEVFRFEAGGIRIAREAFQALRAADRRVGGA